MSDIVERTLLSIQGLIGGRNATTTFKSRPDGFQNVLEVATGLGSKHEEDMVMKKELMLLQKELSNPHIKSTQVKECLVRAIYCEMLGYSMPFAHIHSIKQAQLCSLAEKRIGYLAAALMLHDSHELVILIINTIQKDLRSTNVLNNCLALTVCSDLIGSEMASAVLDLVENKLSHPNAFVRRRAVLAIYHFMTVCSSSLQHLVPKIRACLEDRDPGVVATVLHSLHLLTKTEPESCLDLIVPLVDIQRQIIRRKLPSTYDYRGVPAPWMQLRILQILRTSGDQTKISSDIIQIKEVLLETLQRTDVNQNSAHAIVHQCICTASAVIGATPDSDARALTELVFKSVGYFLESSNPNMKYVGIKSFAQIVKCLSPEHLAQKQAVVMECLLSPDYSIRRNTFDVLFELITASNIQIVFSKMLTHLKDIKHTYSKKVILKRIFNLAITYGSSNKWLVTLATEVLLEAKHDIHLPEVVSKVKEILTINAPADDNLRIEAITTYLDYLERRHELQLSNQLILLGCWTLSRYSMAASLNSRASNILVDIAQEAATLGNESVEVAICALNALEYVVISSNKPMYEVELECKLESCLRSNDYAVNDRAKELLRIIRNAKSVSRLFHVDTARTELKDQARTYRHDWTLSFMDQIVIDAISNNGQSPYKAHFLEKMLCSDSTGKSVSSKDISISSLVTDSALEGLVDRPPSSFTVSTISDVSIKSFSEKSESYEVAKKVWSKDGFLAFTKPQSASIGTGVTILHNEVATDNELLAEALFGDHNGPIKQEAKSKDAGLPFIVLENNRDSAQI